MNKWLNEWMYIYGRTEYIVLESLFITLKKEVERHANKI